MKNPFVFYGQMNEKNVSCSDAMKIIISLFNTGEDLHICFSKKKMILEVIVLDC